MSEEKKEGAQAAAPQDVGMAADAAPAQPAAKKVKEPMNVSRRSLLHRRGRYGRCCWDWAPCAMPGTCR